MSEPDLQPRSRSDPSVPGIVPAATPQEVHQRRTGNPGARIGTARQRPVSDLLTDLDVFPTGVVADAMHRLGAMEGTIRPVWPGTHVSGPSPTVWVRAGDNALIHEAIAFSEPGDVLVVNAQRVLTHAVLGELMPPACRLRGIAGIVATRDAVPLAPVGFPAFARGARTSRPLKDGTGHLSPAAAKKVQPSTIPIVLASRTGAGLVLEATYAFTGSERDVIARQAIRASWLQARKARVLLLLLHATELPDSHLRAAFAAHGALP